MLLSKRSSLLPGTAVTAALMTACLSASALPTFTFNPGAVGLSGGTITADDIQITDYSTVTLSGGGNFTQTGFLPVSSFSLAGKALTPTGLNSDYGLYISFTATGTLTAVPGAPGFSFGPLTSLNYDLWGYNGTATFGFTGNTATESAVGEVKLASGTLISGYASTVAGTPGATAQVSVSPVLASFFTTPAPFYAVAQTSFSSTTDHVQTFADGFRINGGGGSLHFEPLPVPEPSSTVLLLAGLGVTGLLYRRKMAARQS